jgi:hypothetical protein
MDGGDGQASVERIEAIVNSGPVQFPGLFTGEFWDNLDSNADTDGSSEDGHDDPSEDKDEDAGAGDDKSRGAATDDDEPRDDVDESSSSSDGTQSPKIAKVKRESRVTCANDTKNEPVAQPVKRAKTESMHYCA